MSEFGPTLVRAAVGLATGALVLAVSGWAPVPSSPSTPAQYASAAQRAGLRCQAIDARQVESSTAVGSYLLCREDAGTTVQRGPFDVVVRVAPDARAALDVRTPALPGLPVRRVPVLIGSNSWAIGPEAALERLQQQVGGRIQQTKVPATVVFASLLLLGFANSSG